MPSAGDEITPGRVGVLASLGVAEVLAHPRPRVGVMSTGDELVPGPGRCARQIRDSNRPTQLAPVAEAGFIPIDLGWVPDDEDAIRSAIERAPPTATVISSGGVSMGDIDLVRVVPSSTRIGDMSDAGGDPPSRRWPSAWCPARAPIARSRVFGLPGNPVSSSGQLRPVRSSWPAADGGAPARNGCTCPASQAVAAEPFRRSPDGKIQFASATVAAGGGPHGELAVRSSGGQGSHQLGAMAWADGWSSCPTATGWTRVTW